MSSMKFRRTCNGCNATFFATDRRAQYCPKCAKKKQESAPAPKPAFQPRPRPQTANRPETTEKRSFDRRPAEQKPKEKAAEAKAPKRRQLRPPKTSILTDELRTKIQAAYELYKDTIESLKVLHAKISQELWAKPAIVAQVVKELKPKPVKLFDNCTLTEEQKAKVIGKYLEMVRHCIRPEEGRRNAISHQTGVPKEEVILAVREWSTKEMGSLSRLQLFEIEKVYWELLSSQKCRFTELPEIISSRLNYVSPDQVARWLDQLHDTSKLKKEGAEPSKEQIDQVIGYYRDYLLAKAPPEHSLHRTISKKVGVSPEWVHVILCDYRCKSRPEL